MRPTLLFVVLLTPTGPAFAQTTVDAGWVASAQVTPTLEGNFGRGPTNYEGVGGMTPLGGSFRGAYWFSPRIALGAELTVPMTTDYERGTTIIGTYRNVILAGTVHVRLHTSLEIVAGVSFVDEQLTEAVKSPTSVGPSSFGEPTVVPLDRTFGGVLGIDAPRHLGRSVSIVPAIRVHVIHRNESAAILGSVVVQPGLGVRVSF